MKSSNPEKQIFVSVGYLLTPKQQRFLQSVGSYLKDFGVLCDTPIHDETIDAKPIVEISQAILKCDGLLVVAFDRLLIESAEEYPETNFSTSVTDIHMPTIWNQIEASMAYQAHKPILILSDERISDIGVFAPYARIPRQNFSLFECEDGSLPTPIQKSLKEWVYSL